MNLLLAAISVAAAAPVPVDDGVEAEFRRHVTETCPRILSQGRAWFGDDAQLAAHHLTMSPLFKTMLPVPGMPTSVDGQRVSIIYNDSGSTRNTKFTCAVYGRSGIDTVTLRDRFFSSLAPTHAQINALGKDDFVGFAYPDADGIKAHVIVFWRDGVFVKPPEGTAR